mmetsp:Transcript_26186/g.30414  ORF Transcript_26186/g.30414 Transcript_26186/m.30414 type:complete len:441 (+) Transcript_26186:86-1408(+)
MSQTNKRHEPWRNNNERHYCAVCNAWMGSDRQSILIHENGKKHLENLELSLLKRRKDKLDDENQKKLLTSSLKKMEEAAALAFSKDVASQSFYESSNVVAIQQPSSQQQQTMGGTTSSNGGAKSEMKSWHDRKEKRKGDSGADGIKKHNGAFKRENKKRKLQNLLGPNEGHYTLNDITYLDGLTYIPIVEEEMPIQLWTGSSTISIDYRKSEESITLWKTGIVMKVHKVDDEPEIRCDISYLKDINDDDETIEKNVTADRLRLVLGSDELIPKTIEESRLQLMGGEEIITTVDDNGGEVVIDENTGLSTFRTVSIRKVTVSQDVKDERARVRSKRREEFEKEQVKAKEREARKMEEAKYSNADDSALGAYDVWGKGAYKGININVETNLDVNETAKRLSEGKTNVTFKKRGLGSGKGSMVKRSSKKQNRRTTFADDDEDD